MPSPTLVSLLNGPRLSCGRLARRRKSSGRHFVPTSTRTQGCDAPGSGRRYVRRTAR